LSGTSIDLGLNILDHQLLDRDGRRCGKVDDLAIEDDEVVAILAGPDVWRARAGRIGRVAAWLGRGGRTRIPWIEVKNVGSAVELKRTAQELGLGRADDRVRPFVDRIPGSDK
jgi:sporulation protein YlmC with PRC-barrel domain